MWLNNSTQNNPGGKKLVFFKWVAVCNNNRQQLQSTKSVSYTHLQSHHFKDSRNNNKSLHSRDREPDTHNHRPWNAI